MIDPTWIPIGLAAALGVSSPAAGSMPGSSAPGNSGTQETKPVARSGGATDGASEDVQDQHVRVRLVREQQAWVAGTTQWVGVRFEIETSWHIYWEGLNDTGFAPKLSWKLPAGFKAGEVSWPAPSRYVGEGEILDHIYEGAVTLLVPIEVPADHRAGPVEIALSARWLVCSNVCIPEKGAAAMTVEIEQAGFKPAPSPDRGLIEAARARLPRTPTTEELTARIDGNELVIEAGGASRIEFYPSVGTIGAEDLVKNGAAQGETLRIGFEPTPRRVGGVAMVRRNGVDSFFTVDAAAPAKSK